MIENLEKKAFYHLLFIYYPILDLSGLNQAPSHQRLQLYGNGFSNGLD